MSISWKQGRQALDLLGMGSTSGGGPRKISRKNPAALNAATRRVSAYVMDDFVAGKRPFVWVFREDFY
jgi:hypothetical protein